MRATTSVGCLALTIAITLPSSPSLAVSTCVDQGEVVVATDFVRTFTGGASWKFDLVRRQCEGLVIKNAFYKPAGGTETLVLRQASIAELHVVYTPGADDERYRDVTTATQGLGNVAFDPIEGGSEALTLTIEECRHGVLLDGDRVCVREADHGHRWKFGSAFRKAEKTRVFMSTQAGGYNYVNAWDFHDDGSISVRTGMTGKLNIVVQKPPSEIVDYWPWWGAYITDPAPADARIAIAHMHNIYYRLDFDIGGAASDVVTRKTFTPSTATSPDGGCGTAGQCWTTTFTPLTTETHEVWSATEQTSWIISDKVIAHGEGRKIGYELLPRVTGLWRGIPSDPDPRLDEPWAQHELWVTRHKDCEQLAALNVADHLPAACATTPAPAANVEAMQADHQSVDGQNVVVWYANRTLHYPRDEDDPTMPIEWTGFDIIPRNFHTTNPAP